MRYFSFGQTGIVFRQNQVTDTFTSNVTRLCSLIECDEMIGKTGGILWAIT